MNEKVKRILTEIKKYLIKNFGDKIKYVILYGSYARGDYNKNSDIDVLFVHSLRYFICNTFLESGVDLRYI